MTALYVVEALALGILIGFMKVFLAAKSAIKSGISFVKGSPLAEKVRIAKLAGEVLVTASLGVLAVFGLTAGACGLAVAQRVVFPAAVLLIAWRTATLPPRWPARRSRS